MEKFLPAIIFLIALLLNHRYVKRWMCLSNYILFLYLFSAVSYIFFASTDSSIYYTFEGLALIFVPTVFLLFPLSRFEKISVAKQLSTIPIKKVQILMWFLIVIGFYSIIFFIQGLSNLFTLDIVSLRSGFGALYEGGTISSKVACMGAYLYPLSLFLYFYNVVKKQIPRKHNNLLLFSSISFIIYTLNVAGRDGIVLWLLTFVGFYFFFSIYMEKTDNHRMMKNIRWGSLLFIPIFLFITVSRFDGSDSGSVGSVFSYSGQQLYTLSTDIDLAQKTGKTVGSTRTTFEFFYRLSDMISGDERSRENRMENMDGAFSLGFKANSFGTYVHSFYPIYMSFLQFVLFVLFLFGVYKFCLRTTNGKYISSRHLMGALSWYTILMSGVFYFYYGTYIGNVFLLVSLLIIFIL